MGVVLRHRFDRPPGEPGLEGESGGCPDGDLVPVYAVVWAGSAVRVALALARHEPFGVELTLALFALVVITLLLKRPLAWLLARGRARPPREQPTLAAVRPLLAA